ncbi:MAG: helix-turn-helix domain-containing protein, partial [Bacteroidota bacterium]
FLAKYRAQMDKAVRALSSEAMECLKTYDWPGNIRELENVIERAVALEQAPVILPESLPENVRHGAARPGLACAGLPAAGFDLEEHVQDIERTFIAEALRKAGGVQVKAAEMLGMSFRSFRYYVKKYNLR